MESSIFNMHLPKEKAKVGVTLAAVICAQLRSENTAITISSNMKEKSSTLENVPFHFVEL